MSKLAKLSVPTRATYVARRACRPVLSILLWTSATCSCTIVLVKIVADTNTFLAVALDEPEKPLIIDLTLGHELLASEVLPFEVGNALTAMMKKHSLEPDELAPAWDAVRQIPVELRRVDFQDALRIAGRYNVYAYDAYVLGCALATRSPLLTLDRRLKTVAQEAGVEVLE